MASGPAERPAILRACLSSATKSFARSRFEGGRARDRRGGAAPRQQDAFEERNGIGLGPSPLQRTPNFFGARVVNPPLRTFERRRYLDFLCRAARGRRQLLRLAAHVCAIGDEFGLERCPGKHDGSRSPKLQPGIVVGRLARRRPSVRCPSARARPLILGA